MALIEEQLAYVHLHTFVKYNLIEFANLALSICIVQCFNIQSHISMYALKFISVYVYFAVVSHIPPENVTVCRGSEVAINCGYQSSRALPVSWIINGILLTQQEVVDSPLYQLNNPTTPMRVSLTVFSINVTTTFQCAVQSTPSISISARGTITVVGMSTV